MTPRPISIPAVLPGAEPCPGQFVWSAFGAPYMDTLCASALDWSEVEDGYPGPYLCDADDEFRCKGVPCPFCLPGEFRAYYWGADDEHTVLWFTDLTPVGDAAVHFHETPEGHLYYTATHPELGEQRVIIRSIDDEVDAT